MPKKSFVPFPTWTNRALSSWWPIWMDRLMFGFAESKSRAEWTHMCSKIAIAARICFCGRVNDFLNIRETSFYSWNDVMMWTLPSRWYSLLISRRKSFCSTVRAAAIFFLFLNVTLHNCEASVNKSDDPPRIALICFAREVLRGRFRNSMPRRAWEIPDVEFRVFRVCEWSLSTIMINWVNHRTIVVALTGRTCELRRRKKWEKCSYRAHFRVF